MAAHTTSTLSYLLDEVGTAIVVDSAFYGPQVTPALFSMRGMTGRRERISSVGSLGEWQPKSEMASATQDEVVQQYQKTLVPSAYAQYVTVSREAATDEEWGYIARLMSSLGDSFAQTVESKGAALFNDMFTGTTYKAEDAKSICNDAHTNVDAGNSQDNAGSATLAMAGLKSSRTAMRKLTNYRGTAKIKANPDLLLVPVDLEQDAFELVRSSLRPDNANMAANINAGAMSIVAWDELSDTNDWWLIDSRKMAQNLLWLWKDPMELFGKGDLFVGSRDVGGYTRFVHGCVDWKWVYGNSVT